MKNKLKKSRSLFIALVTILVVTILFSSCAPREKKKNKISLDLNKFKIEYKTGEGVEERKNPAKGFAITIPFNYFSTKTQSDKNSLSVYDYLNEKIKKENIIESKIVIINVDLKEYIDKKVSYKFKEEKLDNNSELYKNSTDFNNKFFYLKSTINSIKNKKRKTILSFNYGGLKIDPKQYENITTHIDFLSDLIYKLSASYNNAILAIEYIDLKNSSKNINENILNYSSLLSVERYRMLVDIASYEKLKKSHIQNNTGIIIDLSKQEIKPEYLGILNRQFNIASVSNIVDSDQSMYDILAKIKKYAISVISLEKSKSMIEQSQKTVIRTQRLSNINIEVYPLWFYNNQEETKRYAIDYLKDFLGYNLIIANLEVKSATDSTKISFDIINLGTAPALFVDEIQLNTIDKKDGEIKQTYEIQKATMDELVSYGIINVNKKFDSPIPENANLSIKILAKGVRVLPNNKYKIVDDTFIVY